MKFNLIFSNIIILITFYINSTFVNAMTPIDFKNLEIDLKPNKYTVCPKDYCKNLNHQLLQEKNLYLDLEYFKEANEITLGNIKQYFLNRPRTKLLYENDNNQYLIFVERSKWFKFPDYIYIQIINDPTSKSKSLAVLSKAKYGYYDFEVNKTRVNRLLEYLKITKSRREP